MKTLLIIADICNTVKNTDMIIFLTFKNSKVSMSNKSFVFSYSCPAISSGTIPLRVMFSSKLESSPSLLAEFSQKENFLQPLQIPFFIASNFLDEYYQNTTK